MPEPVQGVWREISATFAPGVATSMDRISFEAICNLIYYCRAANWAVRPDIFAQVRQYLSLFGMTPADRTRINVPQAPKANKYEAM